MRSITLDVTLKRRRQLGEEARWARKSRCNVMPTVSTFASTDWQVVIFCDSIPQTIRNELLWSLEHSSDLSVPSRRPEVFSFHVSLSKGRAAKRQGMNAGRDIKENKSNNKNKDTDILTPVSLAPVLPTATLYTDRQTASVTSFRGTLWFCSLLMLMFTNLWSPEYISQSSSSMCLKVTEKCLQSMQTEKSSPAFLKWHEIPALREVWPRLAPPLFGFLLQVSG